MPVSVSDFVKMPEQFKDIFFILVFTGVIVGLDFFGAIQLMVSGLSKFLGYNIYYTKNLLTALVVIIYLVGFTIYLGASNK